MKVNVKGLVFVGFAAAILSANAMAADNTVTSKSYVDTKFQTIANLSQQGDATGNQLSTTSDTTYPSEKKVAAALSAVGGTVSNSTIDIQLNGTSKGTFTVNQATNGTVNIDGVEVTANKVATIDTTATAAEKAANYPSQAAVEAYVADATDIDNFVEDSITDAVTDKAPSENAVHDALALKEDSANKVATIDTTATAAEKAANYPSQAAVEAYVADATDIDNFVEDSITDAVTDKAPSENAVHDALALKVDIAQGSGNANKTLITDANGNVTVSSQATSVVPAVPNTCTAAAPCVLTNDTTTGALTWVPIQQAE